MKLTPSQFAKQLKKWYDIYRECNSDYFLLENLMLSAGLNWDALFTLNSHFD